jgi:hypothetical protein
MHIHRVDMASPFNYTGSSAQVALISRQPISNIIIPPSLLYILFAEIYKS